MPEPRSIWVGNEPVLIPNDAKVVHVQGERMALVAVPRWTVHLLMSGGTLQTPDDSTNAALLSEYFPTLESSSSLSPDKILNFPVEDSPTGKVPPP